MAEKITLRGNGGITYEIDSEEFEIIKLMVEEAGAKDKQKNIMGPVKELVDQRYGLVDAIRLCIFARHALIGDAQ